MNKSEDEKQKEYNYRRLMGSVKTRGLLGHVEIDDLIKAFVEVSEEYRKKSEVSNNQSNLAIHWSAATMSLALSRLKENK